LPEAPSRQGSWPLELEFARDTLDYPGAVSLGFMARFLRSIEWWRLEPHPELVIDNASRYCTAVPGTEYVVYLRWGGSLRIDLRAASAEDVFDVKWIDLTDNAVRKKDVVAGGESRLLYPPEAYPSELQYKDWLLHIRRQSSGE
jgi:hypothetical protein